MDRSNTHKWVTFCFLLPSSLALACFVFYLTTFTPTAAVGLPATSLTASEASSPSKLFLSKDQVTTMGKIQLTYRGLNAESVVIDITLLDLDPEYAYRRAIPAKAAKIGFWLGQKKFQLLSASPSRLKIIRARG